MGSMRNYLVIFTKRLIVGHVVTLHETMCVYPTIFSFFKQRDQVLFLLFKAHRIQFTSSIYQILEIFGNMSTIRFKTQNQQHQQLREQYNETCP